MELLEAEKVRTDKSRQENEAEGRIRLLARQENEAVSDLNRAKSDLEEFKKKTAKESEDFIRDQKERRDNAKKEADSVESYRRSVLRELLKPIDQIKHDAEELLKKNMERESELERLGVDVEKMREDLEGKIDALEDRIQENKERSNDLDKRESKIDPEEKRLKESAENLAGKWVELYDYKNKVAAELLKRELDVSGREKAAKEYAESLKKEFAQIQKDKRAIRDGYDSLARAKDEILKNKVEKCQLLK